MWEIERKNNAPAVWSTRVGPKTIRLKICRPKAGENERPKKKKKGHNVVVPFYRVKPIRSAPELTGRVHRNGEGREGKKEKNEKKKMISRCVCILSDGGGGWKWKRRRRRKTLSLGAFVGTGSETLRGGAGGGGLINVPR